MNQATDRQASMGQWVIDACREFKLPVESVDDDFFGIGGTSLTLMRLIGKAEQDFGVVLEPDELLEAGTLRAIAALVSRRDLLSTE
jgi:acyl carrier protein